MANPRVRTYSRYTREAASLFSGLIRTARLENKLTVQEVAERAGVSRGLVQRIEKGDLKCEIGAFFEVAVIVGVRLFDTDENSVSRHLRQTEDKLALMPKSVHKIHKEIDDDF